MQKKKRVSPLLSGALVVVALLCLPTFVVKLVRPEALNPGEHRTSLDQLRFRFLLDTGIFLEGVHRCETAVSRFQEAEQFSQNLTDTKYESLQESRQHLAQCYEALGRNSDAEQVYAGMVKSSLAAGDSLLQANKQFDTALLRYQDAERFSQKLTTAKDPSLQSARWGLVVCFRMFARCPEAEPVYTRLIDTQRESADEYDGALGDTYQDLGFTRSHCNDWAGSEQAYLQAIDIYDKVIQHFSAGYDTESRDLQARQGRDFAILYLGVAYENEGKTDLALSTAETSFQTFSKPPVAGELLRQIIVLGLQAATATGNQNEIDLWQQRLYNLSHNLH